MQEQKLLTLKEVAHLLGKTVPGIHWLIKEGRIKPAAIAGKYKFFTPEALEEYRRKYAK